VQGSMKTSHKRSRWAVFLVLAFALAFAFMASSSPAFAAEKTNTIPTVKNFNSARFDMLDRMQAWIGTNHDSERIGIVVIGSTIYMNEGDGWETVNDVPEGTADAMPLSDQVAALADLSEGVYVIGSASVRGQAATQYQLSVKGEKVLDLVGEVDSETAALIEGMMLKYDFWIGADGTFLQQNTQTTIAAGSYAGQELPEITTNSLVTFYDFDDPSINVVAPN
jgi:hypothetical protein